MSRTSYSASKLTSIRPLPTTRLRGTARNPKQAGLTVPRAPPRIGRRGPAPAVARRAAGADRGLRPSPPHRFGPDGRRRHRAARPGLDERGRTAALGGADAGADRAPAAPRPPDG